MVAVLYRQWLRSALCLLFCIDDDYVVRYVLFCVLGDGCGWCYVCFLVCGVLLFCIGNDCAFCTVSVLPVLGVLLFCV